MRYLALLLAFACGGAPVGTGTPIANSARVTPVAPLPGDGDRAFVSDVSGLVEVAARGVAQGVATTTSSWCDADARGRVVWFIATDGLWVFDLVDRTTHPIIRGDLGQLAVIVDWGNQKLGGENPLAFDVAITVHLTSAPSLEMTMGCEGDRAVYCFGDDGKTPTASVTALQHTASTLRLVEPTYVATLAARGAHGSLWTPPPVPPIAPVPPVVDRARCTQVPGNCGKLTAIPGSAWWLVETDNSRGDYFHETRELWDPATREIVRVVGAELLRAPQPATEPSDSTDYGGLRVSPTGGLSFAGAVFDARGVVYAAKDGGETCGWAQGGWRIPGPTDL